MNFLYTHSAKLLGCASAIIIGFMGIDGLIADGHRKYWAAAGVVIGAFTAIFDMDFKPKEQSQ